MPVNKTGISNRNTALAKAFMGNDQDRANALVTQVVNEPFNRISASFKDGFRSSPLSTIPEGYPNPTLYFPEHSLERVGNGLLRTLITETDKQDIHSIAELIMEAKKGSDKELSRRRSLGFSIKSHDTYQRQKDLLTEVLLSVQTGDPIDWTHKHIEEIHEIFEMLDYLGLDQWQRELEKSLPPLSLEDMPETILSLSGTQEELAPFLPRFRALQDLKLEGSLSQGFLDQLPRTLIRLDLSNCEIRGLLTKKEVALAAVGQDGWALRRTSPQLQADKEVVLAAVGQAGRSLSYASAALQANKEVAITAVSQKGWALRYASAELQADKDVVLAAVAHKGSALCYASAELRADRDVVLAAVAQNGSALQFVSAALRGDREVLNAARAAQEYAFTG